MDIKALTKSDVGKYVLYTDGTGYQERGRIKSWNERWIFVVYNCDDNWDNYDQYTAAATDPQDLEWAESAEILQEQSNDE